MKMKNEDEKMKIFSAWPKYFNIYFSETLNSADFKYVFRFFIYFFHQNLQPFKVGPFRPFLPIFSLLWRQGYNFWSKQDMKNLKTYLKSAKLKVSEKYNLEYLGQVENSSFFSSSFSNSLKFFIAFNYSTQNYPFNEVLLLILYFYLQEQLTKMYGLPIFFEILFRYHWNYSYIGLHLGLYSANRNVWNSF